MRRAVAGNHKGLVRAIHPFGGKCLEVVWIAPHAIDHLRTTDTGQRIIRIGEAHENLLTAELLRLFLLVKCVVQHIRWDAILRDIDKHLLHRRDCRIFLRNRHLRQNNTDIVDPARIAAYGIGQCVWKLRAKYLLHTGYQRAPCLRLFAVQQTWAMRHKTNINRLRCICDIVLLHQLRRRDWIRINLYR